MITELPDRDANWFAQPRRWLQLNLVQDDPPHTDVDAWARLWEEARVEGLTISAAGAAAYYPTDVPLHARAVSLGSRDLFGELVGAAKLRGIRVLARFEAFFTTPEIAEAHPEWLIRRADGGPDASRSEIGSGPRPCFNGPLFREFMPAVMTEIASRYPVDGFYANGWPYIGWGPPSPRDACYCAACISGWTARGHDSYPLRVDPDDEVWRDFVTYVQESYEDVQRTWQQHLSGIRAGFSFVCNLRGSLASGIRWDRFAPMVDLFANDSQGRRTIEPRVSGAAGDALWSVSRSAAIIGALAGGKPTCHIVGGWHAGPPLLRRLAKEPLEIRLMLALAVARGARPWCNVGGAVIYDRRWIETIRDYYRWHASASPYLDNARQLSDVGILWTPEALWPISSDPERAHAGPSLTHAFQGWHETLLRRRRPFELLPDSMIGKASLEHLRTIVVPSGARVNRTTAEVLARFVNDGGGLILGCGVLQPGAGPAGGEEILAELAGVHLPSLAAPTGPRPSGYIEITTTRAHELFRGVGETDYLPAGEWTALPRALVEAVGAGRYQPPLPFLADFAYVEQEPSHDPVLTQRGRCVYLGTDLDALHGECLLPDARTVLAACLDLAARPGPPTCSVTGPGIVDVNVWEQERSWTVHLVNLTNPHLYGGPVDELTPVGPQRLQLHLGELGEIGGPARRARLLRAGSDVTLRQMPGGEVSIDVPSIEDFEVVAIDRMDG